MRNHHAQDWIEQNAVFPHSAGRALAGKKVGPYLLPFQKRVIRAALKSDFSPNHNIYLYGCRKVSKSFLASLILWAQFSNKRRHGFQAAVQSHSFEGARLLYQHLAAQKKDPSIKFFKEHIEHKKTHAKLGFFSSNPSAVMGLELDSICVDEIGSLKSDAAMMNLQSGGGLASEGFQRIYLSNPPLTDDHFSISLLKSCEADSAFKVFKFSLPSKDDWTSPRSWAKANPFIREHLRNKSRFGYTMRFYEDSFKQALKDKSAEHMFRRFLLGQISSSETEFFDLSKIQTADESVYKEPLIRWTLGLDYSVSFDFSAAVLLGWQSGKIYLKPWLVLPNLNRRREIQKRVFERWAKQGFITLQNADVLDSESMAAEILKYLKQRGIEPERVCYDMALAAHHIKSFEKFKLMPCRSTPRELTQGIRELQRSGNAGNISFIGQNAALKWMFQNVIVSARSKNYCTMDRLGDRQNIDGAVASALGLKAILDHPNSGYFGFAL